MNKQVMHYSVNCVTLSERYINVRHNSDVITDVKTSWRPSSWRKRGTVHKNCTYLKVTCTRTEPVLLWTAAAGLAYLQTRVYYNLYTATRTRMESYQCEPSLS